MLMLKQLQQEFSSLLLNDDISMEKLISLGFDNRNSQTLKTRMEVYHKAYRHRLKESLGQDFPWTLKAIESLGVDSKKFLNDFIKETPSPFWTLAETSAPFPDYVRLKLGKEYPWLGDSSLFEWHLILSGVTGLKPKRNGVLLLNPSIQLLELEWSVYTQRRLAEPQKKKTHLVIFTINKKIRWEVLDENSYFLLFKLNNNISLEDSLRETPFNEENIFQCFSEWSRLGIISGLHETGE